MDFPFIVKYKLAGPTGDKRYPYLDDQGAFLGAGTPLLEKDPSGQWQPRPQAVIEKLLSIGYGHPVALDSRTTRANTKSFGSKTRR